MMKIRGTTLYPQAVYSALEEIGGISEYYMMVTSESNLSDDLTIYVAVNDAVYTADMIQDKLQARLRVKPTVAIADERAIREQVYTPKSRKPIRFIDKR
jgi:phenylacetate-CoA ligase